MRTDRKTIENAAKKSMGHARSDDAGTKFLREHGFGPTGKKRKWVKGDKKPKPNPNQLTRREYAELEHLANLET